MAGLEARTVVAEEEPETGLGAVRRTVAVVEAPRTVLVMVVVVLRTVPVGVAHRIDPVVVRRIGLEVVRHTDLAEEAADPTAAAEVELHIVLGEVVRHIG